MRRKSGPVKAPAEQVVKDIRRATRRHFSAEEKIFYTLREAQSSSRAGAVTTTPSGRMPRLAKKPPAPVVFVPYRPRRSHGSTTNLELTFNLDH
jgi:hypothetical protein